METDFGLPVLYWSVARSATLVYRRAVEKRAETTALACGQAEVVGSCPGLLRADP